ncbi:MAG: HNH endonuclease [Chthoniobacterales bacterium]|nr:HNH endonuclease [Chthoniobacterales bacterium]
MPLHPAWVKNVARRVLWTAFDKDITTQERSAMKTFFGSKCAYCNEALVRRWHADHLVSVHKSGSNHAANRVPSCPRCNEQEKREMDWLEFLVLKCGDDSEAFRSRKKKIDEWQATHSNIRTITREQREAWRTEVDGLSSAIDASWERLRALGTKIPKD